MTSSAHRPFKWSPVNWAGTSIMSTFSPHLTPLSFLPLALFLFHTVQGENHLQSLSRVSFQSVQKVTPLFFTTNEERNTASNKHTSCKQTHSFTGAGNYRLCSSWCWGKNQVVTKAWRIHPSNIKSVQHLLTIHPAAAEMFQLGIYICLIKPLFQKRFSLIRARFALCSQYGKSCLFEIKTTYLK